MKIIIGFFFLYFNLQVMADTNKTLLILGDSLTEGYGVNQEKAFPALLNERFKKEKIKWTVKPAGSSGSTSVSGLERIKWLTKSKPDLILLLLGSNDGLRGLKPAETEKNLNATVEWAVQQKMNILIGQLYAPPNYGKEYTKKFEKIYKNISAKNKIPLADFLLNGVAGKTELNLVDGIHPNEKGHVIVADNVYKSIINYLK